MPREKFATQLDSALISDLRLLAKDEGRNIQKLVDEALRSFLEERRQGKARAHVLSAYEKSHSEFGSLYKKLAE